MFAMGYLVVDWRVFVDPEPLAPLVERFTFGWLRVQFLQVTDN